MWILSFRQVLFWGNIFHEILNLSGKNKKTIRCLSSAKFTSACKGQGTCGHMEICDKVLFCWSSFFIPWTEILVIQMLTLILCAFYIQLTNFMKLFWDELFKDEMTWAWSCRRWAQLTCRQQSPPTISPQLHTLSDFSVYLQSLSTVESSSREWKVKLTFKVLITNAAEEKIRLDISCDWYDSSGFTWNAKSHFLWNIWNAKSHFLWKIIEKNKIWFAAIMLST